MCDPHTFRSRSRPVAAAGRSRAFRNLYGRDAIVPVVGGTVSQINVAGVNTGLTSGMMFVPNGQSITLTYSVAPTWNWIML